MSNCRRCGAEIRWEMNDNGKNIPIDIKTNDNHFKNCPYAKEFRNKRVTDSGKIIDKEQVSLEEFK